jgi:hypothetical protein
VSGCQDGIASPPHDAMLFAVFHRLGLSRALRDSVEGSRLTRNRIDLPLAVASDRISGSRLRTGC